MVTLGRSDAILACELLETHLEVFSSINPDHCEEVDNLLQFIRIQLYSMAEEDLKDKAVYLSETNPAKNKPK